MAECLLIAGGAIYLLLGSIHALYTLLDLHRPRRIVPADAALIDRMRGTTVRLSRGGSTMWDAWMGFNLSHSLGAILFGLGCIAAGIGLWGLVPTKASLLIPVAVSTLYLVLALRFWFKVPAFGTAIATALLAGAWLLH